MLSSYLNISVGRMNPCEEAQRSSPWESAGRCQPETQRWSLPECEAARRLRLPDCYRHIWSHCGTEGPAKRFQQEGDLEAKENGTYITYMHSGLK